MALLPDQRELDIIVPFYRNPSLVPPLFRSFQEVEEELRALGCAIVAVNDSPDDVELEEALVTGIRSLSPFISCRLIRNERNLGFVRSVNIAARSAVKDRRDVLLLNSDTVVFPGALREIRKVAQCDPLIGFVSPRSNNATLCSFPVQEQFRHLDPVESHYIFRQLCVYLPEFHLAPTALGFCLFIKLEVLDEFGFFDEAYGEGYNEDNDLIMRANRCGYRAALANRAFVYHLGAASFATSSAPREIRDDKNAALLRKRYPEYEPSVARYLNSKHYQAEGIIAGLLPDRDGRLDLVFDLTSMGVYHNGTFEACKEILVRAAKIWRQYNIFVMASEEAVRFHRLDELDRVFFVSPVTERKFAVAFRFSQPFQFEHLFRMSRIAPVNVYGMLDPIAHDCLYLNDGVDLETLWGAVFAHADGVIYISDFVRDQFQRRFHARPGLQELVAYHSLDYRDYATAAGRGVSDNGYILVIGNSFEHKRLPATVDALSAAFPREKILALGLPEDRRQNVIAYNSGHLSERQMDQLWRGARLVVFPSLYEGFGFPVVRSLAYGKPILARSIPTTCAIKERLKDENLILYSSTNDLVRRLREGFPEWRNGTGGRGDTLAGWDAITEQIGQFLCRVTRSFSFREVLGPRLEHIGFLEAKEHAQVQAQVALSQMRAREEQIQEFYNSWSWRMTAPMRYLADVYLNLRRKS